MCWRVVVIGVAALHCSPPPRRKAFQRKAFHPRAAAPAGLVSGAQMQAGNRASRRAGAWPPRFQKPGRPVVPAPTRAAPGTRPQPWRASHRRVARHHGAAHPTTPGSPRAQDPRWHPRSRQALSRRCRPPTANAPRREPSQRRREPVLDGVRPVHAAAQTADGPVVMHKALHTPRWPLRTAPLGRQSQARRRSPAPVDLRKCLMAVRGPPSQSGTSRTPVMTEIPSGNRCVGHVTHDRAQIRLLVIPESGWVRAFRRPSDQRNTADSAAGPATENAEYQLTAS